MIGLDISELSKGCSLPEIKSNSLKSKGDVYRQGMINMFYKHGNVTSMYAVKNTICSKYLKRK